MSLMTAPQNAKREPAKSFAAEGGRVLALDYGRKRIGLALSDELALTSQPAGALTRKNRREDVTHLRAFIRKNNVRHIVIGIPLHLDGSQSEMSVEVHRFAERLRKNLGLPVDLVDERLTSWQAVNDPALSGGKKKRATKSSGDRDAIAAAIILQEYLDSRGGARHSQAPPPGKS
jgi:putative holliday junction resolvase